MNARLEAAPFSAVTAGYKMEHCCFCQASRGAGGRSLALPGVCANCTKKDLLPVCMLQQTRNNITDFTAE